MSPAKGKFSSTQGPGIKGQIYDGLPLFSPETTKSKLIKTQGNKIAVRRELQDQKKPMWREVDSKNVSKIDMTLIKTVDEYNKPHNNTGYTPSEGLKKLQKALESGREEYQKSARSGKSGENSPERSISKMPDSIDSSRVEKKEVFRNPKLGNLPNLKANEEPADEQEHNVGVSRKRNNVKPLALKKKATEDEFDAEDVLDHPDDIKRGPTNTERQKKKQAVGTSGILKSQANSRITSANKNKSPELLNNEDLDANIEYPQKKKNTHKLESLQNKKVPQAQEEHDAELVSHREKPMKKKELMSQEPSLRNSPEPLEESRVKGRRETERKSQNLDLILKKQESRQVSPGKRSDLTIDVDAIEKEHEEVFDFGDEEKKTPPAKKEKSHRQRDEEEEKPKKKTVKKEKEDVLDVDTKPKQVKKASDDDMFDDAVDNRMNNLNRRNLDQKVTNFFETIDFLFF